MGSDLPRFRLTSPMESASGKIETINDGIACVVVDAAVTCPRCEAGRGCGAGLLTGNAKPRRMEVGIPQGMAFAAGDAVTLSIAPRYLLRAAMLAYGLPLLLMLLAVGLARVAGVASSDAAAVVFSATGLLVGIVLGRWLLRREAVCEQFTPEIDGRVGG